MASSSIVNGGGVSGDGGGTVAKAAQTLAAMAGDLGVSMTPAQLTIATLLVLFSIMMYRFSNPKLDAREPPPLKSTIPVIGHLIGILWHQSTYLRLLADRKMKIATLPILNGKMYAIWDPTIIQSLYRNRHLSFEPFALEFAQREVAYDNRTHQILLKPGVVTQYFDAVHKGMAHAHVRRMNVNALRCISHTLDAITGTSRDDPKALHTTNMFVWARDLMTFATSEALYGSENPMKKDPSLLKDLWTFEGNLSGIILGLFPSITARSAYLARERLQAALIPFYTAKHDHNEDVAAIVRERADSLRRWGVTDDQIGRIETALTHVATANTIPTLFWFMAHVLISPQLVVRLREELEPIVVPTRTATSATLDIGSLDEKAPLLVACYREAIRLSNKALGNRRVMTDTTVTDHNTGEVYLLKKGCNVQMPAEVLHKLESAWGGDVLGFDPEARWLEGGEKRKGGGGGGAVDAAAEKLRRASYAPFGGGRHLCPGRNFAFAENLGFVASLVLGFEIELVDEHGNRAAKVPEQQAIKMVEAANKPVNGGEGFGIRAWRREGWEQVKWNYVC